VAFRVARVARHHVCTMPYFRPNRQQGQRAGLVILEALPKPSETKCEVCRIDREKTELVVPEPYRGRIAEQRHAVRDAERNQHGRENDKHCDGVVHRLTFVLYAWLTTRPISLSTRGTTKASVHFIEVREFLPPHPSHQAICMYDLLFLAVAPLPLLTGFLLVDFLFVRLAAHPVGVRRTSMLHSLHRRSRRSAPRFPCERASGMMHG
jgi:hypothetical protein